MSSEAKVGMFFLTALVLVGVIALYLGDFWVRARSYPVTAYFKDVQGLPNGAEVRFAGVKIGRVTAVNLESNSRFPFRPAAVHMAIIHGTLLYDTDDFVVQQSALLGDKYVEVRRLERSPRRHLAAGSEVSGGAVGGLADLTDQAQKLIVEARATLSAIRVTFASEYNQQALHDILANVSMATAKADTLAGQALKMASILTANAAKAGPNVAAMAQNLKDASLSVKSTAQLVRVLLATSPAPHDLAIATGNMRKASADMVATSSNIAGALGSPEARTKIESALDNLHTATANLATVSGQAAKLFSDEEAGGDMRGTMAQMHLAATDIAKITATYEKMLDNPQFTGDVKQTLHSAKEAAAAVSKLTRVAMPKAVRTRTDVTDLSRHGVHADFDVDLQYGDDPNAFWRLGIRGIGGKNGLDLQSASPFAGGRGRVGLIGGKLGAGFDLWPDRRVSLETEVIDPGNLHLDMRGIYGVSPNADVLFGFNRVLGGTDPFIGVRYKTNP